MPKKSSTFSEENIVAAIEAVHNGMSKRAAAQKFNVARSTLQFHLKNPDKNFKCGSSSVLTSVEEQLLVKWIIESSRKGFPRRREDVQYSVKKYLDINTRKNPFPDNLPGVGWYKAFLHLNSVISTRTSEHVTAASANVSEFDIRKWFTDLNQYLIDQNFEHILKDPCRLFNADESGFALCPKTKSVLGPKGTKDIYEVATGNSKENLTVMFSFNAAGEMCNPMVLYNYKRIPQSIIDSVPPNWCIGHSDSGWMVSEVFYEFVANVFHPFLVKNGIEFPVILFVDGHKSHLTFHLSNLCSELKIILIALYPNATRILQPADVAAFRPLNTGWKKGVFEWRNDNPNCAVTKKDFAPILNKVISETIRPEILINGFKACGLYPFNPDQIDFKKCLGRKEVIIAEKTDVPDCINPFKLDYNQFSDIVGSDMLDKFKDIQGTEIENYSQEFHMLYKLHEKLKYTTMPI